MKACFVFVPERYNDASSDIPVIGNQGGKFPPMQFAYLASVLGHAGHEAKIIDANALGLSKEDTVGAIKKFNPDMVGFSTGVVMFRETISWIKHIKNQIDAPVVVGGDITLYYPKQLFSYKEVDYGVMGYDENTIVCLLESLGRKDELYKVSGLIYRTEQGIKMNYPIKGVDKDLNRLPAPAREHLPNNRYYEFYTEDPFTIMMTSTGCSCSCSFCFDKTDKLVEMPVEKVIEELRDCYYTHGVRDIDFRDRTFTLNRSRAIDLCREIKMLGLDVRWSCMTRIDLVDKELLKEMKGAGCVHIKYGLESGSKNILASMSKRIKLDLARKNIKLTKEAGIETYGFFMMGDKNETRETAKETIKLAKELDLDYAHFQRYTIWPNRPEYAQLKDELGYDLWERWMLDSEYRIERRNLCKELSETQLNSLLKRAYLEFYFRPSYIIRRLLKLRSPKIMLRSISAAFDILTDGLSAKAYMVVRSMLS